jgi:tetratricopeptide (TPR) repeat protein
VYFELGDLDRALAHLDDARRDLLLIDDPVADSACAHAEGMVLSRLGDYGLAQPSFERALRLRRRLGDDGAAEARLEAPGEDGFLQFHRLEGLELIDTDSGKELVEGVNPAAPV